METPGAARLEPRAAPPHVGPRRADEARARRTGCAVGPRHPQPRVARRVTARDRTRAGASRARPRARACSRAARGRRRAPRRPSSTPRRHAQPLGLGELLARALAQRGVPRGVARGRVDDVGVVGALDAETRPGRSAGSTAAGPVNVTSPPSMPRPRRCRSRPAHRRRAAARRPAASSPGANSGPAGAPNGAARSQAPPEAALDGPAARPPAAPPLVPHRARVHQRQPGPVALERAAERRPGRTAADAPAANASTSAGGAPSVTAKRLNARA